ncbi:MAG: CoA-binding protein [Microgenomates group bacterium]
MNNHFFSTIKTIAVVGISDKPDRPSYKVGEYLRSKSFIIIPINPSFTIWRGLPSYPTLSAVPNDIHIDVVDIFRKSEFVYPIVVEAVKRNDVKTIWMQEGIKNDEAKKYAEEHGLSVVMDFCMMIAHKKNS